MMKSTLQISKFFAGSPDGCIKAQLVQEKGNVIIDAFLAATQEVSPFADPSFLVPSIIDALRQHPQFEALTHVVPGEADNYCASYVSLHGGTVITSDSDLLVHNLGAGQVVFFRDLHRNPDSSIFGASYSPSEICQQLELSPSVGLARLAYERKQLSHASLPQIMRACSQPAPDQERYQAFCQQYRNNASEFHLRVMANSSYCIMIFDPRISELYVQLAQLSTNVTEDPDFVQIYLPVLVECPNRTSAWEHSTTIRQLAYTVLASTTPTRLTMHTHILEYRRVQSTLQKGRKIALTSAADVDRSAQDLLDLMERIRGISNGSGTYWVMLHLALDARECRQQDKESHAWWTFHQRLNSSEITASRSISWDIIHLVSQIHATCYSLRMLQQVLSHALERSTESVSPNLGQLQMALTDMSSLSNFPDIDLVVDLLTTPSHSKLANALADCLNLRAPAQRAPRIGYRGSFKMIKSANEKATGKRPNDDSTKPWSDFNNLATNNMFSLLSVD
ncbi:hypothetical protein RJ55_04404 [Drechmeria coniospora]|nr:hypothetical protein RJ55_04404 [Drechmeria coniospora]